MHKKCLELSNKECDGGSCKKQLISPAYVKLPLKIEKLYHAIQPIIIIINSRSGGQMGEIALQAFYSLLNPIQVIDVFIDFERIYSFQGVSDLRILVAGGDGTVSRLLNTLYDEKWKGEIPSLGIFPLGTGNDLSIVFNWGRGLKSRKGKDVNSMIEYAQTIVKSVNKSYPSYLDR